MIKKDLTELRKKKDDDPLSYRKYVYLMHVMHCKIATFFKFCLK